jgi:hypothetical protein
LVAEEQLLQTAEILYSQQLLQQAVVMAEHTKQMVQTAVQVVVQAEQAALHQEHIQAAAPVLAKVM